MTFRARAKSDSAAGMELVVSDLAVARGGVSVLAGLGFRLGAGQALILRGPNGAGKTTLLRTIAGLQSPLAGRIDLGSDGVAYSGHADAIKATLTVRENLDFWAAIHGAPDIGPAMAAMNLADLDGRAAQSLSAGQRRRLGLARLVLTSRRIWLLDEPTVSLDAASVALFLTMIGAHLAEGGCAVMATHIDLDLPGAAHLDLSPFGMRGRATGKGHGFDEAFL